jgi:hypothetical protein
MWLVFIGLPGEGELEGLAELVAELWIAELSASVVVGAPPTLTSRMARQASSCSRTQASSAWGTSSGDSRPAADVPNAPIPRR